MRGVIRSSAGKISSKGNTSILIISETIFLPPIKLFEKAVC